MKLLLRTILCMLLVAIIQYKGHARQTDSSQLYVSQLYKDYQGKKVADTVYLHAIDSLLNFLLDDENILHYFDTYRNIAFSKKEYGRNQLLYFRYRGIYEVRNNRHGKAIFYFEKMAQEAAEQKNPDLVMRANLSMIVIFLRNKNHPQAADRYALIKPAILHQVDNAEKATISPVMADICCMILSLMPESFFTTGNGKEAMNTYGLLTRMYKAVVKDSAHYGAYVPLIRCSWYEGTFTKHKFAKDNQLAEQQILTTLDLINSPAYPADRRPILLYDTYKTALDYYLANNNIDSVRKYLEKMNALRITIAEDTKDTYYNETMSQLLAAEGNYPVAYGHLLKAYKVQDSTLEATLIDRDNNVYAQTMAEYNLKRLQDAEKANLAAERRNILLKVFIGLLLLVFVAGILWLRQHQKNKYLNAKLKMARNIHDEIGPTLLFAKMLTTKEKELSVMGSGNLAQVESELNNAIETVRGLSHDLKSTKEFTTSQLYHEMKELFEKTEKITGISYSLLFNKKNKTLNYFQYQHIRNIILELVNNTIKHSDWKIIEAVLQVIPKKMIILYSDNGPGFAPDYHQKNGIGLENIKERVQKLKGELTLNNNYPEGYTIEINIPLA